MLNCFNYMLSYEVKYSNSIEQRDERIVNAFMLANLTMVCVDATNVRVNQKQFIFLRFRMEEDMFTTC